MKMIVKLWAEKIIAGDRKLSEVPVKLYNQVVAAIQQLANKK